MKKYASVQIRDIALLGLLLLMIIFPVNSYSEEDQKTRVFLISEGAVNFKKQTLISHHGATLIIARSKAEAEGLALAELKKAYPISDGWFNYDADATEASKKDLLSLSIQAQ